MTPWDNMGVKISKYANVTFKYIKSFVLSSGFQNCFSFFNATHGSRVMELQRSKVNFGFVQGRKNKVIPIFLTRCQIVRLYKRIQKSNSLHYVICQVNKIQRKKVDLG